MIRHVVMIKFKQDAPQEKIDIFLEEIRKLPHLNKEIRDYSHGMCVTKRYHSGDLISPIAAISTVMRRWIAICRIGRICG